MSEESIILSIRDKLCQTPVSEPDTRFIKLLFDKYKEVMGDTADADELLAEIPDRLFKNGPEDIGRAYRCYLSVEKDEAFETISRGGRLESRYVPPATQVFTPKWIARYMAENSIGRAAYEMGAIDGNQFARLKSKWRYYIDGGANARGGAKRDINTIRVLDPCVGSGNLLLSAFDVLMDIYLETGYEKSEAARSIFENNLYGADIDKNAVSIAAFALWAKARENAADIDIAKANVFTAPPEIGSLERSSGIKALEEKYDAVIVNPPYMGSSSMPLALSRYVSAFYPDGKSDLFAAFILRCRELTKPGGYLAVITQCAWMFLKSFAELRSAVLSEVLVNMLHLGSRAFDGISGEVVNTAAFVAKAAKYNGGETVFVRLVEPRSGEAKEKLFLSGGGRYSVRQDAFSAIPGKIAAYWASPALVAAFKRSPLKSIAAPRQGLATGDNDRFLRLWHEVPQDGICFEAESRSDALKSGKRWFPYNKGGKSRKWYGNDDYVVDWSNDGNEIRTLKTESGKLKSRPQNLDKFFKPSVTWSKVSSNDIAFRYKPRGFIFDVAGTSMFADEETLMYLLAFCNSSVALEISRIVSPTMNFEVGQIASFPVIIDEALPEIAALAKRCVEISKRDWDSFETSWNFEVHPMLANRVTGGINDQKAYLETSLGLWRLKTEEAAQELKALQEDINRRFIAIYGLENASGDVSLDEMSIRRILDKPSSAPRKSRFTLDKRDAAASLISYAIGCAFARFKPFGDGLGSADRIIILSEKPSENDAVSVLKEFLIRAYSSETLGENLRFIALALSNGADGREKALYGYFFKRFYAEHLKTYQKRPIYWLFDDGEFKALVYMHGFGDTTVNRIGALRGGDGDSPYARALKKASLFPVFDPNDGVKHNHALYQDIEVGDADGKPFRMNLLAPLDAT